MREIRVAIFGLGGVGSWCAEALVRTGVRKFMLVDCDRVAASNVNRQAMATPATVGKVKIEAMAARMKEIEPGAEFELRPVRYDETTAGSFGLGRFDFAIDAIDSIGCKARLVREVIGCGGPELFSSMGAARRFDPTRVRTSPFSRVEGDALAKALRRTFRRTPGGMPEKDFFCVWSAEPLAELPDRSLGSLVQTTAVFGLALAALVTDSVRRRCRA